MGMGTLPAVDCPSDTMQLMPGDKVILMSDGVYNALNPRELCLALQHPAADAAEAIKSFIRSRDFPDQDNFTAVILECA
jgi:serine phosphatase RsbU (regulator of sigma subunit)